MGLGEATRSGIYTISAAHRPPSHMTLMGKVCCDSGRLKRSGNQIPDDPTCETSAVGAARRLHGFSMASM
jgi:hypothetical protein